MQVNIQQVFDKQKANFDHFNELNTLISSIIPGILPDQKTGGCVNSGGCLSSNKYGI